VTVNGALTAISGVSFLSVKRSLNARSRTGSLNRTFSGQALRDDNVRRLCDSIVGANGCSPVSVFRAVLRDESPSFFPSCRTPILHLRSSKEREDTL
jgi:hypothetical protein